MGDSAKTKKPAVKAAPKVKKMPKTTAPAAHPKYREMIVTAIQAMKSRTGSSRQAILQHVIANNNVAADQAANYVKLALKKGLDNGVLRTAKDSGKGAGSFKLTEDYKQVIKDQEKQVKKMAAKKAAKKTSGKIAKKTNKKAAKKPKKTGEAKNAGKKPVAKKVSAKKSLKPAKKLPKWLPRIWRNLGRKLLQRSNVTSFVFSFV